MWIWVGSIQLDWVKTNPFKITAFAAFSAAASQLKWNTWKAIQIWQCLIRALMTNGGNVSKPGGLVGCHCLAFVRFELISFSFAASTSPLTGDKKWRESLKNELTLDFFLAQAALQSRPAGGVRHAVEEGLQHHHSGRADHWQGKNTNRNTATNTNTHTDTNTNRNTDTNTNTNRLCARRLRMLKHKHKHTAGVC